MAKVHEHITYDLRKFIEAQHIFFVASAPLSGVGHVNLSPKGQDCLRVLSTDKVAYLDLTGSGNETSAHVQENGRITLMFCAFEGSPNILRLYGTGRVILPDSADWDALIGRFTVYPGARQIVEVTASRTQTSCGFAVPYFDYVGERDALIKWAENRGETGLEAYHREKNLASIDGLPTPMAAHQVNG